LGLSEIQSGNKSRSWPRATDASQKEQRTVPVTKYYSEGNEGGQAVPKAF